MFGGVCVCVGGGGATTIVRLQLLWEVTFKCSLNQHTEGCFQGFSKFVFVCIMYAVSGILGCKRDISERRTHTCSVSVCVCGLRSRDVFTGSILDAATT